MTRPRLHPCLCAALALACILAAGCEQVEPAQPDMMDCSFEAICKLDGPQDGSVGQAVCGIPFGPCCPLIKGAQVVACPPPPGGRCYRFIHWCLPTGWLPVDLLDFSIGSPDAGGQ